MGLDNDQKIPKSALKVFKGDLQKPEELKRLFELNPEIKTVIHFAAFLQVGESVNAPLKYWKNNVAGTMNLLEAMKNAGVENIVFSSTCAIFGQSQ